MGIVCAIKVLEGVYVRCRGELSGHARCCGELRRYTRCCGGAIARGWTQ